MLEIRAHDIQVGLGRQMAIEPEADETRGADDQHFHFSAAFMTVS